MYYDSLAICRLVKIEYPMVQTETCSFDFEYKWSSRTLPRKRSIPKPDGNLIDIAAILSQGYKPDGEGVLFCLLLLVDVALDSVFRFLLDARDASLADLDALYGAKAMQPSFSGQSG